MSSLMLLTLIALAVSYINPYSNIEERNAYHAQALCPSSSSSWNSDQLSSCGCISCSVVRNGSLSLYPTTCGSFTSTNHCFPISTSSMIFSAVRSEAEQREQISSKIYFKHPVLLLSQHLLPSLLTLRLKLTMLLEHITSLQYWDLPWRYCCYCFAIEPYIDQSLLLINHCCPISTLSTIFSGIRSRSRNTGTRLFLNLLQTSSAAVLAASTNIRAQVDFVVGTIHYQTYRRTSLYGKKV